MFLSNIYFVLFFMKLVNYNLAAVENLALRKNVYMDSAYVAYPGSHAVDGNLNTMAHTANGVNWLIVDLGDVYRVQYVKVYNRGDDYFEQLDFFSVGLSKTYERPDKSDVNDSDCGKYPFKVPGGAMAWLNCTQPYLESRYVTLFTHEEKQTVSIMEFEIFGDSKTSYLDQYVGCYESLTPPVHNAGNIVFLYECSNLCASYTYMAVTNARECHCGNVLGKTSTFNKCNISCTYDNSQCGSTRHFSVYTVSEPSINSSSKDIVILVLAIVFGSTLFLFLIILIIFCIRRRNRKQRYVAKVAYVSSPNPSKHCEEYYEQISDEAFSSESKLNNKNGAYESYESDKVGSHRANPKESTYTGLQEQHYLHVHC